MASVVAPAGLGAPTGHMTPIPHARSNDGATSIRLPGNASDLRGSMPVLPTPVFGLVGRNTIHFPTQQPESAAPTPSGLSRSAAVRPASSARPIVPPKTTAGGNRLDLNSGPRASAGAAVTPVRRSEETQRADSQPEQASNGGRRLFDQDRARSQDVPREPSSRSQRPLAGSAAEAGARPDGASGRVSDRTSARPSALASQAAGFRAPAGETLRDAVAAMPLGAAPASIAPAAVLAPPLKTAGPGAVASAQVPVGAAAEIGVPTRGGVFGAASRPPLLDVPASGMIGGPSMPGASAPGVGAAPHPSVPMSPTVWLERGSLFEAVSVAEAYAGAGAHAAIRSARAVSGQKAALPLSPSSPIPMSVPRWWGWALLPLLIVVVRGHLR